MGLDMYLGRRFYVKNWDHMKDDEKHKITVRKGGKKTSIPTDKICYIETQEAYWRKANQIHKWFVDNVQDGEDDCGAYDVSREQLKDLIELCQKVLADHSLAKELLPNSEGFFFGSQDYDEYYFGDLEDTIKQLTPLLDTEEGGFEYRSSW